MNPKTVFGVFLVLGLIWTGVWAWVLTARRTVPYPEVAPRVALLRRRLLPVFLVVGTVLFLVSLSWLAYPSVRAKSLGQPQHSVDVTGVQWMWTLSRDTVPLGVPVEFRVTATDVNHGFGIYSPEGRLVAQVQAMPRYTNRLVYRFDQPGTYAVRCLEYCGVAHHIMVTTLTVKLQDTRGSDEHER